MTLPTPLRTGSATLLALALVAAPAAVPAMTPVLRPAPAYAQTQAPSPGTIAIGLREIPVHHLDDPRARRYVVDHMPAGSTITRRLEVTNHTDAAQRIDLYSGPATVEGGAFIPAPPGASSALTQWISVSPSVLRLGAGESAEVVATIAVPSGAPVGEQYGVIWASHTSAASRAPDQGTGSAGSLSSDSLGPGSTGSGSHPVASVGAIGSLGSLGAITGSTVTVDANFGSATDSLGLVSGSYANLDAHLDQAGSVGSSGDTAVATGIDQISRVGVRVYLSVGTGRSPTSGFEVLDLRPIRDVVGLAAVIATVANTGQRAVDVAGTLDLTDGPGGLTGPHIEAESATIAPGQQAEVVFPLGDDSAYPQGEWTATASLASGALHQENTREIALPATEIAAVANEETTSASLRSTLPWAAAVAVAGLLGAIVAWRRRRAAD